MIKISALDDRLGEASESYHQTFSVSFEYAVCFTENLFAVANPVFRESVCLREPSKRHRLAVFVDDGVAAALPALIGDVVNYAEQHAAHIDLVAIPEIVPGGERCKNDPQLIERLQKRLLQLGMDRHSFVVAVGGGAMLDVVGYVAATTHRGVRHIRVPTTVLAQADSGVGVKNGYNAFGVKNLVGAFAPPFAVLNDARFIDALHRRDVIAGMAEAVKVALIRDATFFHWIEANADQLAATAARPLRFLIRRCAELHMQQIATGGDPFESGSARPLDYGHWSAHKLEALTGHALRHGEAVAIGIALDAHYAVTKGLLRVEEARRIYRLLKRLGFTLWDPALGERTPAGDYSVLAGLREFREHLGGELSITLLDGIGRGAEVHDMDAEAVIAAIEWLRWKNATA